MAPYDDTRALLVRIRLVKGLTDQLVRQKRRLPDHLIRKLAGLVELCDHLLRVGRNVREHLIPVEIL